MQFDISKFRTFGREEYVRRVRELVASGDEHQPIDRVIAQAYCDNLKRVAPLCRSVGELHYLSHMQKIATLAADNDPECT